MKAKIKFGPNAGREIDVVKFDDWNYRNVKSGRLYGEDELDFSTVAVDWSSFRREAAKDILAAIISGDKLHCPLSCEEASNIAIQYADALIAKLKEK